MPLLAEVVQQLPCAIEHLHHAPHPINDVKMPLGIKANSLGPEHRTRASPDFPDGVLKRPGSIQHLHAESSSRPPPPAIAVQPKLGGIVELAIARSRLADRFQHAALHVHHEDLIAQRVGDVDPCAAESIAIPVGRLKNPSPSFRRRWRARTSRWRRKQKSCPNPNRSHRCCLAQSTATHCGATCGFLPLSWRDKNLYFSLSKSKMCTPAAAGIGDDDASLRIRGHAVRLHHAVKFGLEPTTTSTTLRPETPLGLHFALQAEDPLKAHLPAAIQQQIRAAEGSFVFLGLARCGQRQQ